MVLRLIASFPAETVLLNKDYGDPDKHPIGTVNMEELNEVSDKPGLLAAISTNLYNHS
jgi:hypothetical protein